MHLNTDQTNLFLHDTISTEFNLFQGLEEDMQIYLLKAVLCVCLCVY